MSDLRRDETPPISEDALLRLRSLCVQGDSAAVAELITALDDPASSQFAASLLGQIDRPEAVEALLVRLRSDPDWKVRAICAEALGSLEHPEVLPSLVAALRDEVPEVVEWTCRGLGAGEDTRAIEPLQTMLQHPDWSVRVAAIDALLGFGIADTALAEALAQLENDPATQLADYGVSRVLRLERLRAEFSDQSGAPNGACDLASTLHQAREELGSPDPVVRIKGVNRLRGFSGLEGRTLLLQAFDDSSHRVRSTVALLLGSTVSDDTRSALVRHLREDPSPAVRLMSAVSLQQLSDPQTVEPLMGALREGLVSGDWKLTMTCALALGELGDRRAVPLLLEALGQPHWSARRSAAQALLDLRVGDERLVTALERMALEPEANEWNVSAAESERDLDMMREFAAEAGDPEPCALPTMQDMIDQARQLLRTAGMPTGDTAAS